VRAIVTIDHLIGPWVCQRVGTRWLPDKGTSIGLMDGSEILAGVYYEDYNRANIVMSTAAVPGSRWMTREFLWYAFYYPFVELGCKRITAMVAEHNVKAQRLDEHLGFKLEAALKQAHPDGDLLVYSMFKEDCRWLKLRGRHAHKEKSATSDAVPGHPPREERRVECTASS
jgi:hypothetical protein